MNKVYCNKETDMVEQILKVDSYDELPDNYFNNCYAVIDEQEIINGYNVKYNKDTKEFEVVAGLKPKDEVIVEETPSKEDYDNLKQENESLKSRIEKLEELLNVR